jgi:4-amino-4-deoxychorismate lyase
MFRFVESLCLQNGKLMHLDYHLRRMRLTLAAHSIKADKSLFEFASGIEYEHYRTGKFKVRIIYSGSIEKIEVKPYKMKVIKSLRKVYSDIEYTYKYADRTGILSLLPADLNDNEDILIIKNGCVTDSSYSSIAFYQDGVWFLPDTPLLISTSRMRLVENGSAVITRIKEEDIFNYSKVSIFNAMVNFDERIIDTSMIS